MVNFDPNIKLSLGSSTLKHGSTFAFEELAQPNLDLDFAINPSIIGSDSFVDSKKFSLKANMAIRTSLFFNFEPQKGQDQVVSSYRIFGHLGLSFKTQEKHLGPFGLIANIKWQPLEQDSPFPTIMEPNTEKHHTLKGNFGLSWKFWPGYGIASLSVGGQISWFKNQFATKLFPEVDFEGNKRACSIKASLFLGTNKLHFLAPNLKLEGQAFAYAERDLPSLSTLNPRVEKFSVPEYFGAGDLTLDWQLFSLFAAFEHNSLGQPAQYNKNKYSAGIGFLNWQGNYPKLIYSRYRLPEGNNLFKPQNDFFHHYKADQVKLIFTFPVFYGFGLEADYSLVTRVKSQTNQEEPTLPAYSATVTFEPIRFLNQLKN